MDLDLSNLSWEQKALLGVGAIVLIILIYAYVPWGSLGSNTIDNNTTTVVDNTPVQSNSPSYAPVNQEAQNSANESSNTNLDTNSANNNTTSNNQEKTTQITTLQAKDIAAQEGLDVGSPRSGTFKQGNENVQVWIVPLSENGVVIKEVYIDKSTGEILATQELNNEPRTSENNKINTTIN